MSITYADQTIRSPNPLARYAHRSRLQKSVALALQKTGSGESRILDYGCGSGVFVSELRARNQEAVGYEPFMEERSASGLPIFARIEDVAAFGPYGLITLLETVEHLHDNEIDEFLQSCQSLLCSDGGILMSAPIEIGPAMLLKELNRYLRVPSESRAQTHFDHSAYELLKASLLGIPARRASDIKISHKGFDFRKVIGYLRNKGWNVQVISYGPLPISIWYGNSQIFLWVRRPQPSFELMENIAAA